MPSEGWKRSKKLAKFFRKLKKEGDECYSSVSGKVGFYATLGTKVVEKVKARCETR